MGFNLFGTLNRTSGTALLQAGVARGMKQFNNAAKKIQNQKSFTALSEAHGAGASGPLARVRSGLAAVEQRKLNNVLTKADNQRQANLLADINAEVQRFDIEIGAFQGGQLSSKTREQIADEFFDNMERLINTREGGKYLLNPSNPNEKPIDGPAGTLKNLNNVVDNLATSNYTTAEENLNQIEVADESFVRTNPLHAGAEFIREYLAMGHNFKENAGILSIQASKDAGLRAYNVMQLNVANAAKKISDANDRNTVVEEGLLQEMQSIEEINLPVEAVRLNGAVQSLTASFNLSGALNRLDTQLVNAAAAA